MSERTTLQTMSGAVLSISATLPATYDAAGYGATAMAYTAIGNIEDHGEHGVTSNVSTFTAVNDAVVQKLKGAKNYGTKSLVVGYVPSDAGQDIVEAAVESNNRYSAKVQYPAGQGESTGEIHYLDILVTKRTFRDGAVDNVRRLAVDFEICRKPVIVAGS